MGEINSKRTDTSPNEQRDPSEVVSITCLILDHSIRSGFRISWKPRSYRLLGNIAVCSLPTSSSKASTVLTAEWADISIGPYVGIRFIGQTKKLTS